MKQLNLMFLFTFSVPAESTEEGIKKAMPTVERCEKFADALGLLVQCDHVRAFDGQLPIRVVFNVKGPQNSVFGKVSALFAFAASAELSLINQEFLAEKPFHVGF